MLGESLTQNMNIINGISVSYISDTNPNAPVEPKPNENGYTFIKIWDGKQDRNKENFLSILPEEIRTQIKNDSTRYTYNNQKTDYNETNIFEKINGGKNRHGGSDKRGGFRSQSNRGGGGGYRR